MRASTQNARPAASPSPQRCFIDTPDGRVLFLASAERTDDPVGDGPIAGSAVGLIGPAGELGKMWKVEGPPRKLEGVDVTFDAAGAPKLTLVTDAGRQVLEAGTCAGFPAGRRDAHHLVNEGAVPARYLEIGERNERDQPFRCHLTRHVRNASAGTHLYEFFMVFALSIG